MSNQYTYERFNYELPVWVNEKNVNDYIEKMNSDKEFATLVLLQLLEKEKDSHYCCNLQKFFDSWVYGMNVMD